MIDTKLLRKTMLDVPSDARADHNKPLEDRGTTATAAKVARITGKDGTWAEREAVALALGLAAHRHKNNSHAGRLSIGDLARKIDKVHLHGAGGPALGRLRHLTRAVHDRRPLTVRRYLVEFGKLQTPDALLNLMLLAGEASVAMGEDRERARQVVSDWQLAYQHVRSREDVVASDSD